MNKTMETLHTQTLDHQKNLEDRQLVPLMKQAWEKFHQLGLPHKKMEDWRYTDLIHLIEPFLLAPSTPGKVTLKDISPKLLVPDAHLLILIDGRFCPDLGHFKDLDIQVDNLAPSSMLFSPDEEDALELLNLATLDSHLHINLPAHSKTNIQVLHLFTNSLEHRRACSRLCLDVQESASVTVLETFACLDTSKDTAYMANPVTEISLEKGAQAEHVNCLLNSSKSLHVGKLKSELKKDASLYSFSFSLGGKVSRNNLSIKLLQKGAYTQVNGVFALSKDQHCDNFSFIDHQSSHTYSSQLFKGILDDTSRGIFTGKIKVEKDAQLINSEQLSKNLLLSPKAQLITRPILQISADDVKCSHGATVGQINQEEVFYLESRGIPRIEAQKILCKAFAQESINTIKSPIIRKYVESFFFSRLKEIEQQHFTQEEQS